MNTGMIPVRYAKALLEFAQERNLSEQVYREMCTVSESFERERTLRHTLDNPILKNPTKAELIRAAAGGRVSEVFDRFVTLILTHRRENCLQSISLMYQDLYRKQHGISTGYIETATELTPEMQAHLKALIAAQTQGTVELKTGVKPELLGGFVFEMNSNRLDASVATQLRQVRQQFIEKNKRIV